jgi:predicted transcriptional regulator
MGRRRFKDLILCNILQVCGGGGANKTQIVYLCNLNFHTVVPYLDLLTRNGLVERVEGEILRYRTTLKGAQALQHFQEIEKLMPEMEVQEEAA